jgi:signal transduction histidine kinase
MLPRAMGEDHLKQFQGGPPDNSPSVQDDVGTKRRLLFWPRGLQGRLVLSFALLLTFGLEADALLYGTQTHLRLVELLGAQARQSAYGLSRASQAQWALGKTDGLTRMGEDLLRSDDILFVGFYDARLRPISITQRDPKYPIARTSRDAGDLASLSKVHLCHSYHFGDYVEVWAPIFSHPWGSDTARQRVLGYVAVGVSQTPEEAQLSRINLLAGGIALVVVLSTLPLVFYLVHQNFLPIRQLVDATKKIAAGNCGTAVDIDRSDVLGTLAHSFNQMAKTVKRQQDDLAAANRQLEEKVQQRTSELAAANARLNSEVAEKEEFLRAVSHDLSGPLRNIHGMAAMLLLKHQEKLDEEMVHRLQRIQKNVEIETDLIGELLDLSRIKTRRQKMEAVDVAALVSDVAGLFENDLRSHEIALQIDTPLPWLICERSRMRQVFMNLVDNAIKYMGQSSTRQIRVGFRQEAPEAHFYVRDTGPGIDAEDLANVFLLFRRGRAAGVQKVAGKGVGLASVKSIIETYGGRVWGQSELGNGTTFYFTIDAKNVISQETQPRPAAA